MAPRSMTGFGQAEAAAGPVRVRVEMRSVNHRFSEFSIRLPRDWSALEPAVRQRLAERISRGRVDVSVQADWTGLPGRIAVDWALFDELVSVAHEAARRLKPGDDARPAVMELLQFPGVVTVQTDTAADELTDVLWSAVDQALDMLLSMREREGARLARVLTACVDELERWVARMAEAAPQAVTHYEARIREKLVQAVGPAAADDARLWTEVTLFADRAAVDEEIARLRSHIAEFRQTLQSGGPMGRRLDFLVQEMHREANTIGAKSQDLQLSRAVVEAKVLIEQLREQAQNIE